MWRKSLPCIILFCTFSVYVESTCNTETAGAIYLQVHLVGESTSDSHYQPGELCEIFSWFSGFLITVVRLFFSRASFFTDSGWRDFGVGGCGSRSGSRRQTRRRQPWRATVWYPRPWFNGCSGSNGSTAPPTSTSRSTLSTLPSIHSRPSIRRCVNQKWSLIF